MDQRLVVAVFLMCGWPAWATRPDLTGVEGLVRSHVEEARRLMTVDPPSARPAARLVHGTIRPSGSPGDALVQKLPAASRRRAAEAARRSEAVIARLKSGSSFADVLALVAARNPDVVAATTAWRATHKQLSQASFLEDSLARYRALTGDLQRPMTAPLSFPSAASWRGELANIRIEVARLHAEQVLRTALDDAARSFVDARFAAEALAILEESRGLLAQSVAATRAQLALAQGGQVDLLRSESTLATLDAEIVAMRAQRQSAIAHVNALLAVPANTEWSSMSDPSIQLGDRKWTAARSQEVRQALRGVDEAAAMVRMAETMAYPHPAPTAEFGANAAYIDELRVRVVQQRHAADAAMSRAELAVRDAQLRVEAARVSLDIFEHTVAPRAKQTFEAVKARYSNAGSTLVELIETARAYLDAETKTAGYRRDFRKAQIDLVDAAGVSAAELVSGR